MIHSITYPRSGKLLLTRLLCSVEAGYLMNVPNDIPTIQKWELANFPKNHDYGKKTRRDSKKTYIIQIRNPVRAMASNYKLLLDHNTKEKHVRPDPHFFKEWATHDMRGAEHWRHIAKEWGKPHPSTLFVSYEDLVEDPVMVLRDIANLMGETLDVDIALKVVECVRPRGSMEKMKWFDLKVMRGIEYLFRDEMRILGLPSFEDPGSF